MKILTKILFLLSLCFIPLNIYADENDIPINIKTQPEGTPSEKPKSPSYIGVSAYIEGNVVVVTSQVDTMAQIRIFETVSGQSLYDQTVCLAPQWSCPICVTGTMLTLQVIIDGTIYEGTFIN